MQPPNCKKIAALQKQVWGAEACMSPNQRWQKEQGMSMDDRWKVCDLVGSEPFLSLSTGCGSKFSSLSVSCDMRGSRSGYGYQTVGHLGQLCRTTAPGPESEI